MNVRTHTRGLLLAVIVGALSLAAQPALAQEPGESAEQWASWWYGMYAGANYNLFEGELPGFGVVSESKFDAGSGLGLGLGGVLEYNPGGLLGFNLMVGYDNRAVDFDDVTTQDQILGPITEKLSTSLAYLTFEPNLRINLGDRFLHLNVGPSFGINIGKGVEYTTDVSGVETSVKGDLDNVQSLVIGAQAGVGYDIPLTGAEASTQILLTPFAQFRIGLQNHLDVPEGDDSDYGLNAIRGGLQLKFGSRPTDMMPPPPEEMSAYDFTVRAPMVIAETRKLNETFPLRNYVFFDAGSTDIPSRYVKLSSGNAANFREEQLLKPTVETGGSDAMKLRSRRQMEVYYNVVNVFGDRLRRNPSATVQLVGSANGNKADGSKMAENVKNYLVSTFGIDGSRITTEGRAMPTNKSGSGSTTGDDKKLIDAENYRVEFIGSPAEIMQPVSIVTLEEEPIGNDVVFTVSSPENVGSWSIEIAERGGQTKKFGPYNSANNNGVVRIDARDILGEGKRQGQYNATVMFTGADGMQQSAQREFRLVRVDPDEEQTGERYSILFEFDESKTVQTYETFLTNTVAPAIPDGASVIIHGHTDQTGTPEYNAKLSSRRADEAQKILTQELKKQGKTVTFDTYGFGEDERRSPFNNTLPEQRYYNRTVVVEIVPGQ